MGISRIRRHAVALAVVALAWITPACQQQAVNEALERSTTPLLVPQGEWTEDFRFTAPPGSTDLYEIRWNFRPGRTDLVTGWQVAETSDYDETSLTEGPDQASVDRALRAARGDGCEVADEALQIQLCAYPSELSRGGVDAYLVRLVQNRILVVTYLNIDGDPSVYDADSLEARYLAAEFASIRIDSDEIDRFLVAVS